ncbi:MAG: hydrogenase maturation nickel metallochaperone HypA [Ignavibacteria bacterium]
MHELSVAENIIETVKQNVPTLEMAHVKEIRLKLGEFSNVVADSLIFAFESLKDEYNLNNSELVIQPVKFEIECSECGAVTSNKYGMRECAICGSFNTQVLSGEELLVSEIELID